MKRLVSLFLAALLLLSGCRSASVPLPSPADQQPLTAVELLDRLLTAVPEGRESPEIVPVEDQIAFLMLYGVEPAELKDCAIAHLNGARAFELAVLDLNHPSTAAEENLLDYLWFRQAAFTGYAPDQAAIVEDGRLFAAEDGTRLVLAITEDPGSVAEALASAGYSPVTQVETPGDRADTPSPDPIVSTEPSPEPSPEPTFKLPQGWRKYTPPNADDMSIYDTTSILEAWKTGSDEALSQKDKELYHACCTLIDQRIEEGMTDYQKEWAIYSWLITYVQYDWSHGDPAQTTPRDSFCPYGALVDRKAVCLGYATAFQLLMDMLEVECITVVGAAFASTGDHAWNMVRLNGEWYCLDATWDRGRGKHPTFCSYFNVTSDHMARTDHQWDYENTPMATAKDGGVGE